MSDTLRDLAVFVRSKNAGPFMLTIDLFFADEGVCDRIAGSGAISAEAVAAIYRIEASTVQIIRVPQAHAIKISFPRPLPAGDVGDKDVAGGQQFVPLLGLEIAA